MTPQLRSPTISNMYKESQPVLDELSLVAHPVSPRTGGESELCP
jgi:hypothetical protein